MIRKSLNKFIRSAVPEVATVLDAHQDLKLSTLTKPFITISYVAEMQSLWVLGDVDRKNDIKLQLSLYASSFDEQVNLQNKIKLAIENAYTDNHNASPAQLEPGIPLMGVWDQLTTTNQLLYSSNQPNWFTLPTPIVYKNGTVFSPLLYTVNYTNGTITFGSAQAVSDIIRADYKVGVLDLSISSINELPITDVDNITHKFNSFFTIDTFYYIKAKGVKLI